MSSIEGFGSYLEGILPADVAVACGAFNQSMRQIKNIEKVSIEKFAQVVINLETVKDLDVNGSNVPVDSSLVSSTVPYIALGSGPNGSYTMSDLFGAMSGLPYIKKFEETQSLIEKLSTNNLQTIYDNLYSDIISGLPGIDAIVQNYINQANTEILNIYNSNIEDATALNTVWNGIGTQLKTEQRARSNAFYPLPDPKNPDEPFSNYPTTQVTFVDNLGIYATDTMPHMTAQTLEAITDLSTVGGRSIVGVMREQRNQSRLTEIGISLDNNISSELDQTINDSITKTLISNGNLDDLCIEVVGNVNISNSNQESALYTDIGSTNPMGYYDSCTDKYIVTNAEYNENTGDALQTGRQIVPGSFAASPYQNLISPNLNVAYLSNQLTPSTFTVSEAVNEVIKCNCECWEKP